MAKSPVAIRPKSKPKSRKSIGMGTGGNYANVDRPAVGRKKRRVPSSGGSKSSYTY